MPDRSKACQPAGTLLLLALGLTMAGIAPANAQGVSSDCNPDLTRFDAALHPTSSAWGVDFHNSHRRSRMDAGMDRDELDDLRVEWAAVATPPLSLPTSTAGVVFFGAGDGRVFALDQLSGCTHWSFQAESGPTTTIGITNWVGDHFGAQRPLLYFADAGGNVYLLDMLTGHLLWSASAGGRVTGTPVFADDTLFVPVADNPADDDDARPGVVAMAIQDGHQRWPDTELESRVRADVRQSPVIDEERSHLVFATGGSAGAVVAVRLDNGTQEWSYSADTEFSAGVTMATTTQGSQLIVAADHHGVVHALNPTDGSLVWRRDIGYDSGDSGVHAAIAADNERVYVPLAGWMATAEAPGRGGLIALDLLTGQEFWASPATNLCQNTPPNSSALCATGIDNVIAVVDDAVITGHLDGRITSYDASDGSVMHREDFTSNVIPTLDGGQEQVAQFKGGGVLVDNGRLWATGITSEGQGILLSLSSR